MSQKSNDIRSAVKRLDKLLDELAYVPADKWNQSRLDQLHSELYAVFNLLDRTYGDEVDGDYERTRPLDFTRGDWHGVVEEDDDLGDGDSDEEEEVTEIAMDRGD